MAIKFLSNQSISGTLLVEGVATFNSNIVTDLNISLVDSTDTTLGRLNIGAGSDLVLYHDATNSYIQNSSAGRLRIDSNSLEIRSYTGGELFITADLNGAVTLYYDNTVRLNTTATGTQFPAALVDTSGGVGTSGQILSSTVSGVSWINAPTGSITGSGTSTRVAFWDTSSSLTSDANLYWDNTNDRLGIGTNVPDRTLSIVSSDSVVAEFKTTGQTLVDINAATDAASNGIRFLENGTAKMAISYLASGDYFQIGTNWTTGGERFVVKENGNVGAGVGAENTSYALEVFSAGADVAKFSGSNATTSSIHINNSRATVGNTANLKFGASNNTTGGVISSVAGTANGNTADMSFQTINGGTLEERLRLDNTGQIKLSNYGGSGFTGTAAFNLSVDSAGNVIQTANPGTGSGTVTGSGTATRVAFWSGTTALSSDANLYWDNGNDRLGIGTAAPSSLLHLSSASSPTLRIVDTTNGVTLLVFSQDSNAHVGTFSNTDLIFDTNSNERMRILNGGNVGIGNTNPAAKLQVSGSVQLDVMPTNESEGSIKIGRYDANTSRFNLIKNFVSSTAASNYMKFSIHNGTENATVDVLSLDGGGQVQFNAYGNQGFTGTTAYALGVDSSGNVLELEGADLPGGPYLPLAGGTMTGNTRLNDDVEISFGNSDDMRIYHSGTDANIRNFTGPITIEQNTDDGDIIFKSDNGSGGLDIYYKIDGGSGLNIFGKDVFLADNVKSLYGSSSDLKIYHDGSNSFIQDTGTGNLLITSDGASVQINKGTTENMAEFITDGAVKLYYDSVKKFETTSTGVTITDSLTSTNVLVDNVLAKTANLNFKTNGGLTIAQFLPTKNVSFFGDVSLTDNKKLKFGAGPDFEIYHNSTTNVNYISSLLSRQLLVTTDTFRILNSAGTEQMFRADVDDAVQLYFNNAVKLATTSSGVTITGNITFGDSHFIGDDDDDNLLIESSANENVIINSADDLFFRTSGTTQLQISSSSATFAGDVSLPDGKKLQLGAGNDLQLRHTGGTGDSYIENYSGNLQVFNYANDKDIRFSTDNGAGGTTTYFTIDGLNGINQFSKNVSLPDNVKAKFGNSSDLQIYHDGSNSYIDETGTGALYIQSNIVNLRSSTGEWFMEGIADGAVNLYHNNVKKFETTSTGVEVVGKISGVTAGTANTDAVNFQQLTDAVTGVLVYKGVWDASNGAGGSPDLQAVARQVPGHYYIVSADGNAVPNGTGTTPDEWAVGDWCVFSDQATDAWQKIDNTNILTGAGTGGTVSGWAGSGTSVTLGNTPLTFAGTVLTTGGDINIGNSASLYLGDSSSATTGKAVFGTGNDLELYSNGTDGYVVAPVDDLVLQAADDIFIYTQGGEDAIIAKGNAAVELYHNNAKKFETTSAGVSVTSQIIIKNATGGDSQILLEDNSGSTQNASITFDQAGDNQLYITTGYDSPNDLNRIYFQPGGETAMTIRGGNNTTGNAGNVGIGTTTPGDRLTVDGGNIRILSGNKLILNRANNGTNSEIYTDTTGKIILNSVNGEAIAVQNAGSTVFTINSSGNVGIGTTAPGAALEVNSGGGIHLSDNSAGRTLIIKPSLSGSVHQFTSDNTAAGYAFSNNSSEFMRITSGGALLVGTTSAQSGTKLQVAGVVDVWNSANTLLRFQHDGTRGIIETFTSGGYSNTVINPNGGNVGIGTTTPASKLDVAINTSGNNVISTFKNANTTAGNRSAIKVEQQVNATGSFSAFLGSTIDGKVFLSNDSITANHLIIDTSGNVGLGTTTPTSRLVIVGSSAANSTIALANTTSSAFWQIQASASANNLLLIGGGNVGIGATAPTGKLEIQRSQVTTQFDRDSFLRLHPSATTNSGGFTNIFFGTSTTNNFGVAVGGRRGGTGDTSSNNNPEFSVRILNDAITGTEVLNINTAGNATFSGDVKVADRLLINATSAGSPYVSFDQDGTEKAYIQYVDSGDNLVIQSDNITTFRTGGNTERMRIKSTGQIQFNAYGLENITGTAAYLLAVEADGDVIEVGASDLPGGPYLPLSGGTLTGSLTVKAKGSQLSSSGYYINSQFSDVTGGANVGVIIAHNDTTNGLGAVAGINGLAFLTFGTSWAERMRITSAGNVGIGTTAPSAKLHVSGNTKLTGGTFEVSSDSSVGGSGGFTYSFRDAVGINNPNSVSAPSVAGYVMSVGRSTSSGVGGGIYVEGESKFVRGINALTNSTFGGNITVDGSVAVNTEVQFGRELLVKGEIAALAQDSGGNQLLLSASSTQTNISSTFNGAGSYAPMQFETGGAIRLQLTASGNLGIGNTSPAKKLEISSGTSGDGILLTGTGSFATGSSRNIEFSFSDTDTSYASAIKFEVKDASVHGGQIGFFTDGGPSSSGGLGASIRAMTIDPSQNVGIGTASPTGFRLVVENTSEDLLKLHNSTDGLDALITFTNPGGTLGRIQGLDNGGLGFDTGNNAGGVNTNAMLIDSSGKVGIGTTSPSEPLEVVGVISSADSGLQKSTFSNVGNDLVLVANAGKTNVSANLLFKSSVSGGNTTEKLRIDTSGAMQFGTGTNNAGFIDFDGTSVQINTQRNPNTGTFVDTGKSNASINLVGAAGASYIRFNTATGNNTTATEKVRITDTGKVGIGTNDPSTLLTLTDGAIPYSGTNILLQIKRDAVQGNDNTSKASILLGNNSNAMEIAYGGSTDRLRILDGGGIERFTLLNGGNIGISKTAPAYKIDVAGGAIAIRGNVPGTSLRLDSTDGTNGTSRNALYVDINNIFQIGNTNYASNNIIGNTTVVKNQNALTSISVTNTDGGTASRSDVIATSSSSSMRMVATSSGYTGVSGWADAGIITTDSGTSGGLILNAQTAHFSFQTATSEKMRITSAGNVGIGTTNPGHKLAVNGTFKYGSGLEQAGAVSGSEPQNAPDFTPDAYLDIKVGNADYLIPLFTKGS